MTKPLRIGIDIRGLLTGKISGVEQYQLHILKHLFAQDQVNEYVLFYVSYKDHDQLFKKLTHDYPFLTQKNVEVRTLKWPNFPILLHAAFKPLNWPKADIVCGGLDVMFMPSPMLLPLSSKCAKVTTVHDLIFMIHPEFFTRSSRLWQWQMGYGYEIRTSDIAIAVSHSTKRDILRFTHASPTQVRVVHEGVDASYFKDHSKLLPEVKNKFGIDSDYLYFVGSLEPRKNLSTLIRALSILKQNKSATIKLVISGQKSWLFTEVKDLIAQLNLTSSVIFTGPVTETEKITLLQGAQAFVFPSVYEGFGLMVLEAFATQTPVIVANNSSLPEVAGGAALVFDTFDHEQLAREINRLLTEPKLRDSLTTAGLARAKALSWDTAAKKTLELLTYAASIHAR